MGNMYFTFGGAVKEICARVNDPDQIAYKDRAGRLLMATLVQTAIKSEEYTTIDYPGLVGRQDFSASTLMNTEELEPVTAGGSTLRMRLSPIQENQSTDEDPDSSANPYWQHNDNIIKVLNIVSQTLDEDFAATRKFVEITIEEANKIAVDSELEPIFGEVYWWVLGKELYFHPSPGEAFDSVKFIMEFLENPSYVEDGLFYDNHFLTSSFSLGYIYDCMDLTVTRLMAEIQGE